MNTAVIYIHGKGGNAAEAEHYIPLFSDCDVIGFDYQSDTPWHAKSEFSAYFEAVGKQYDAVILIADSIGAFFTMHAQIGEKIQKAFFISPVVDMEKLIADRMAQLGVTEEQLQRKKKIETPFGEPLSWEYLCYVRENPIRWTVPTHILYGEKDALTSLETMSAFAEKIGAALDVMAGGEHWFHTDAQMAFLDSRIRQNGVTA